MLLRNQTSALSRQLDDLRRQAQNQLKDLYHAEVRSSSSAESSCVHVYHHFGFSHF